MVSVAPEKDQLAMRVVESRQYIRHDVVTFRKTNEKFGGLSNMAPGYPIDIMGLHIRTSEALYQACRFPHLPEVQAMILAETSPMTAKMRSKPYRKNEREDWMEVRVGIMKWCLRVKLACNWSTFSKLLLATDTLPIVEDSSKDDFWGAKPDGHLLEGRNVLGRVLMELRERVKTNPSDLWEVRPLPIDRFVLLGRDIPTIECSEPPLRRSLAANN